jgi:hypothetical protein
MACKPRTPAKLFAPLGILMPKKGKSKVPSEIEEVLIRIEQLRKELLDLETGKGLSDSEVIKASQKLNTVLNEYYGLLLKHKK